MVLHFPQVAAGEKISSSSRLAYEGVHHIEQHQREDPGAHDGRRRGRGGSLHRVPPG